MQTKTTNQQDFTEWENEVTQTLTEILEISRGDAQGVVETKDFYMMQYWTKGLNASDTGNEW